MAHPIDQIVTSDKLMEDFAWRAWEWVDTSSLYAAFPPFGSH